MTVDREPFPVVQFLKRAGAGLEWRQPEGMPAEVDQVGAAGIARQGELPAQETQLVSTIEGLRALQVDAAVHAGLTGYSSGRDRTASPPSAGICRLSREAPSATRASAYTSSVIVLLGRRTAASLVLPPSEPNNSPD